MNKAEIKEYIEAQRNYFLATEIVRKANDATQDEVDLMLRAKMQLMKFKEDPRTLEVHELFMECAEDPDIKAYSFKNMFKDGVINKIVDRIHKGLGR